MKTNLHKISVLCISYRNHGVNFFNQLLLLIVVKVHVPFGKARFSSSVLNEHESDLDKHYY